MVDILIPSEKRYVKLKGKGLAQFQNGEINWCCKVPEHLYRWHYDEKRKLEIWRCQICGRHHYVLKAEPGRLNFHIG